MGFRFNKRFKVAPGLHINFSAKRGFSATVGVKGASHNVGLDGRRRTTISAPGTGLSHVTEHRPTAGAGGGGAARLLILLVLVQLLLASCWCARSDYRHRWCPLT